MLFQGCPADNELSRKLETGRKHELLLPLTASAIIMRKILESCVHLTAEVLEVWPKGYVMVVSRPEMAGISDLQSQTWKSWVPESHAESKCF